MAFGKVTAKGCVFERADDGSVSMRIPINMGGGEKIFVKEVFTKEQWIRIIATLSNMGDNKSKLEAAKQLHGRSERSR